MAYTAATALTEVRAILNESVASFWTDTEIAEWIKQGCLDWSEKSLMLTYEDTITLVDGTYKYTTSGSSYIDSAFRTIHCEHDNKALKRLTFEQFRGHNQFELGTDVDPEYYYDKYNGLVFTIYIGPTPSPAQDTETVNVIFACQTDDITKIPYEHQTAIFYYAASRAKTKERQWQEAQLLWQIYLNNVTFSRKDKQEVMPDPKELFKEI